MEKKLSPIETIKAAILAAKQGILREAERYAKLEANLARYADMPCPGDCSCARCFEAHQEEYEAEVETYANANPWVVIS